MFGLQYYYDRNHAPQKADHDLKLEQFSKLQLFLHTFECGFLQNKISLTLILISSAKDLNFNIALLHFSVDKISSSEKHLSRPFHLICNLSCVTSKRQVGSNTLAHLRKAEPNELLSNNFYDISKTKSLALSLGLLIC